MSAFTSDTNFTTRLELSNLKKSISFLVVKSSIWTKQHGRRKKPQGVNFLYGRNFGREHRFR